MFYDPAEFVSIHWIDSTMKAGWGRIDPDNIILDVFSVGFFVYEDDTVIGITQSLSGNPDNVPHHNALFIPKVSILETHLLDERISKDDESGDDTEPDRSESKSP